MKKVTGLFQQYKEATRHLRNTSFVPESQSDWETVEAFDEISFFLFKHLVNVKLGIFEKDWERWGESLKEFKLVASSAILPIMINRDGDSGYWDNPVDEVQKGDLEIAFTEYFDWDQFDLADFRYIKGKIQSSEKYPELIGYNVLIESIYVDVFYDEKENKDSSLS